MTIGTQIELAKQAATQAHEGQKRNNGDPYITHPERVAKRVKDELKPAAWLHDVLEDTHVTAEILDRLATPRTLELVKILTRSEQESYLEFILRISGDKDASEIKLADIADNLSDHRTCTRRDKYELAEHLLRILNAPTH